MRERVEEEEREGGREGEWKREEREGLHWLPFFFSFFPCFPGCSLFLF